MTKSMYCLYVGFDINALAQGVNSFLTSQVWLQAVAGARTYGTMYVCMYVHVCIYVCMYVYMCVCMCICAYVCVY